MRPASWSVYKMKKRARAKCLSAYLPVWFDKLTTNGANAFALSLSKGVEATPVRFSDKR